MKYLRRNSIIGVSCFALAMFSTRAATLPADWQHEQSFEVVTSGFVKLSLPVETLDAARPGLEDLRVYDDGGGEVPYVIEHPSAAPRMTRQPKSFQVSLNPENTVITIETGTTDPIDWLMLRMQVTPATAARTLTKSVVVESSSDGRHWREVLRRERYFSPPMGLRIDLGNVEIRPWLRLTFDDNDRSEPVPFTGASMETVSSQVARPEAVPLTIVDRQDSRGKTRLTLRLPEANLDISRLIIVSPQRWSSRRVALAMPQIEGNSVREHPVGKETALTISVEGEPASTNLSVEVNSQVRSRELLMLIDNHDSPPLLITSVHAKRMPVYVVFLAKQAGAFHLLAGNAKCASPQYNLAEFESQLKSVAVAAMNFSPLTNNPAYRAREVLPEVQDNGAALDVTAWAFRKPIKITHDGVQELEPDPEVLSRSHLGLEDARVLRSGKQVPYILERTSISRGITPSTTVTNDSENPHLSRWILKLPRPHLPVNRLVCEHSGYVFQRSMVLYEELSDERGDKYRRVLTQSTWIQPPNRVGREFTLSFDSAPQTDTLYLETDNGDNQPIVLEHFSLFYSVTRMLFKAKEGESLLLYYGNPEAGAPHYDLSLVANELLAANKTTASLGVEEAMKKSRGPTGVSGKGGVVFWGILALVVVALLIVIARLLPKSEAQPPK